MSRPVLKLNGSASQANPIFLECAFLVSSFLFTSISQLISMGYLARLAEHALIQTDNRGILEALDWIESNPNFIEETLTGHSNDSDPGSHDCEFVIFF